MGMERHRATLEAMQSFERQHAVRLHAMLLLASAGLGGLLVSRLMLHWGLQLPLLRFPIAVLVAYGLFLGLVEIWLILVAHPVNTRGLADWIPRTSRSSGSAKGGLTGKGGTFDGGGASASFDEASVGGSMARAPSPLPAMAAADANVVANTDVTDGGLYASVEPAGGASGSGVSVGSGSDSGSSSSSSSRGGGGDLFAIIVFIAVLAACVAAVGWVITSTPGILVETAVEAGVATGMIRSTAPRRDSTWFASLCERTWRKAGLLVLLAFFLGVAVRMVDPQANTVGEAVARALKQAAS